MIRPLRAIGIHNHPIFLQPVARRRKFVTLLAMATLVPYYAFILVAGFALHLLAKPYSGTSAINIGWPVGVVLVVGTWLRIGLYIWRTNGEFDELTSTMTIQPSSRSTWPFSLLG